MHVLFQPAVQAMAVTQRYRNHAFITIQLHHVAGASDYYGVGELGVDFAARWKDRGEMDDCLVAANGALDLLGRSHVAPLNANAASPQTRGGG